MATEPEGPPARQHPRTLTSLPRGKGSTGWVGELLL